MIEPTEALLNTLSPFGVRGTFFVDATYLVRLEEESGRFPALRKDLEAVRAQLACVVAQGHDVQLHVHPHWVDSSFDGNRWVISTARYRLHDFDPAGQERIVTKSKSILESMIGRPVFAFRAGGWCLQPFHQIAQALKGAGLWLESTAFPGGHSRDADRSFDYRAAPTKSSWRFEDDPCIESKRGVFVEIPISSFRASPALFWRMALVKKLSKVRHRAFGDGVSISYGAAYYLTRVLFPSWSVASVDGMKAGALRTAYTQWRRSSSEIFHVMGHPKALTRYSLDMITEFLKETRDLSPVTLMDFAYLRPVP